MPTSTTQDKLELAKIDLKAVGKELAERKEELMSEKTIFHNFILVESYFDFF